jgi:hypothetical protein
LIWLWYTMMRLVQNKSFKKLWTLQQQNRVENKFEYYKKEDGGYKQRRFIMYFDTDLTIKEELMTSKVDLGGLRTSSLQYVIRVIVWMPNRKTAMTYPFLKLNTEIKKNIFTEIN